MAISRALLEKDDLDWVGRQLWWRGHPMEEACWRPSLLATADIFDPELRNIETLVRGERDDNDDRDRDDTLADRVAPEFLSKNPAAGIWASRIMRRVSLEKLPSVIRMILEVASGIAPEFEHGRIPADKHLLISAMDLSTLKLDPVSHLEDYEDDELTGERFRFREAIGPVLADIAAGFRSGSLGDAANASRFELERARDDVVQTMELVQELYRATQWIYGPKAFGLRFASWISRKRPESIMNISLLVWVLLRRVSTEIISSDEIKNLHLMIMSFTQNLRILEKLSREYGDVHDWLKPKYLKKAFSDKLHFDEFVVKLRSSQLPLGPEINNR